MSAAAMAVTAVAGCTPVTTAPSQPRLEGHWLLDRSASDDVEARVARSIADAEAKLRKRRGHGGPGGPGGPASDGGGPESGGNAGADNATDEGGGPGDESGGFGVLGPDFAQLRGRLMQALSAPAGLTIAVGGEVVRITPDNLPARDYRLGEVFARFDEYGTATIDSSWSDNAFVLRARYTSRATRTERYEVDVRTDALTLTVRLDDPTVGKIELHSLYRRG